MKKKNHNKLYTTPEQVLKFHEQLVKDEQLYPEFPETLKLMRERNLLSEKKLPIPAFDVNMTCDEFKQAYDRIPMEANRIIDTRLNDKTVEEHFIFPEDRDVFCIRHFHNFGAGDQIVNRFFSLNIILEGECNFLFKDEVIRLKTGDICIIPPNTMHCIQPHSDTFAYEAIIRASTFNVMFNEFVIADNTLSGFFRNVLLRKGHETYCILHANEDDDELLFYLLAITRECINESTYANACAISLIKLFLARVFRKYGDSITVGSIDFYENRPDAASVLQFIRSHYRDLNLTQTAEYFHYSKAYLSQFIQNHFQRSFMEIVTDLKIDNAKEFLRNSNKRIADIAMLVGYDTANHFSRTFKQHEGVSPIEYRRSHKS